MRPTHSFLNAVPLVGCLDRLCGFATPVGPGSVFGRERVCFRAGVLEPYPQTVSMPGDVDEGFPGLKDGKKEAFFTRPRWFRLTKWFFR